jgi:ParB family chromosome partitioning protein
MAVEADVRERALAWAPEVMRFASSSPGETDADAPLDDAQGTSADGSSGDEEAPHELAA